MEKSSKGPSAKIVPRSSCGAPSFRIRVPSLRNRKSPKRPTRSRNCAPCFTTCMSMVEFSPPTDCLCSGKPPASWSRKKSALPLHRRERQPANPPQPSGLPPLGKFFSPSALKPPTSGMAGSKSVKSPLPPRRQASTFPISARLFSSSALPWT